MRTLSHDQIRALVLLAREAHAMEFPPSDLDFDDWRHRQVMAVVERAGLRECRNEDFLPLKAHFLRLLGRDEEANAALLRAETEPRTWALSKLYQACDEARPELQDAWGYACGFLRRKRGVPVIDEASDKDIWSAVFLIRRRAAQLRRREPACTNSR